MVATRRLSSKTDLYPRSFILDDVRRIESIPVASGGYADIYKGEFQGKVVCLKTIRIYQTSKYGDIVKTIAREAILWGQLSHTNLLPFHGLHRTGQQLSLVSPWAEAGNMLNFLQNVPTANRVLLCSDVARGTAYLHENDIVHGDLKAVNILIDGSHRAYLADFGLSGVEDLEILHWTSQSSAASRGGTVRWQAPELFKFESSKNADVYAWSCVCYEAFTGLLPFYEYPNDTLVVVRVWSGVRPTCPPHNREQYLSRGLTEDMWALMTDCWGRDPLAR
ncbi:kinase-like domain-containing protein, partial [Lyophyllum atratum]